eukprot:Nitzschia sp. Nitz4//scaffold287_size23745//20835//21332//NITZ4_008463-RA/size23745-processed-gene-0.11-mRNA-1//1//CDS//3329545778//7458//frame0
MTDVSRGSSEEQDETNESKEGSGEHESGNESGNDDGSASIKSDQDSRHESEVKEGYRSDLSLFGGHNGDVAKYEVAFLGEEVNTKGNADATKAQALEISKWKSKRPDLVPMEMRKLVFDFQESFDKAWNHTCPFQRKWSWHEGILKEFKKMEKHKVWTKYKMSEA